MLYRWHNSLSYFIRSDLDDLGKPIEEYLNVIPMQNLLCNRLQSWNRGRGFVLGPAASSYESGSSVWSEELCEISFPLQIKWLPAKQGWILLWNLISMNWGTLYYRAQNYGYRIGIKVDTYLVWSKSTINSWKPLLAITLDKFSERHIEMFLVCKLISPHLDHSVSPCSWWANMVSPLDLQVSYPQAKYVIIPKWSEAYYMLLTWTSLPEFCL